MDSRPQPLTASIIYSVAMLRVSPACKGASSVAVGHGVGTMNVWVEIRLGVTDGNAVSEGEVANVTDGKGVEIQATEVGASPAMGGCVPPALWRGLQATSKKTRVNGKNRFLMRHHLRPDAGNYREDQTPSFSIEQISIECIPKKQG